MSRMSRVCRHMAVWRLNWYVSHVWRHTTGLASQLVYVQYLETHSWSSVSAGMCPVFGDTQLVLHLNWYVSRVLDTWQACVSIGMCPGLRDTQLVWRLNWYLSNVFGHTASLASQLVCVSCFWTHASVVSQLVCVSCLRTHG